MSLYSTTNNFHLLLYIDVYLNCYYIIQLYYRKLFTVSYVIYLLNMLKLLRGNFGSVH